MLPVSVRLLDAVLIVKGRRLRDARAARFRGIDVKGIEGSAEDAVGTHLALFATLFIPYPPRSAVTTRAPRRTGASSCFAAQTSSKAAVFGV